MLHCCQMTSQCFTMFNRVMFFVCFSCTLQVMTYSQPYQITLELEMPESPANQQLGMFLVKMSLYSKTGQIIDVSARSVSTTHRNTLLTFMPISNVYIKCKCIDHEYDELCHLHVCICRCCNPSFFIEAVHFLCVLPENESI